MTKHPDRRSRWKRILIGGALGLVLLGVFGWDQFLRVKEVTEIADAEENYLYGGLTTGPAIPHEMFSVMPEVFVDLLPGPGGYESLGLIVEEGRDHPIGFAKQTVGFPGVTPNCAMCHTGTYRVHADSARVIVPGAPARADITAFNRFLWAAVEDERYRASVLIPAMRERFDLSLLDRLRYRFVLLPMVKKGFQKQRALSAWQDERPDPGWGRVDAFSILKYDVLEMDDDGTVGTSDPHALWEMNERGGQRLHWAGVSRDLVQVDGMSLYATNLGPKHARFETFERMRSYMADLDAPRFPFEIDSAAAARGRVVYGSTCASCHEQRQGQIVDNDEVGTDGDLLAVWTEPFREQLMAIKDPPYDFSQLTTSEGYVSVRMTGVWMRAPYLHNGSVPTLRHLLEPVAERPVTFYRWSEVYDPEWVGFEWREPPPSSSLDAPFDTRERGNSNAGHEFGTALSDAQKQDLLEYLKTL